MKLPICKNKKQDFKRQKSRIYEKDKFICWKETRKIEKNNGKMYRNRWNLKKCLKNLNTKKRQT